jgi:hypothetical protein
MLFKIQLNIRLGAQLKTEYMINKVIGFVADIELPKINEFLATCIKPRFLQK